MNVDYLKYKLKEFFEILFILIAGISSIMLIVVLVVIVQPWFWAFMLFMAVLIYLHV